MIRSLGLPPAKTLPPPCSLARASTPAARSLPCALRATVPDGSREGGSGDQSNKMPGALRLYRGHGHDNPVVLISAAGGVATAFLKTSRSPTSTTCCSARVIAV